MKIYLQIISSGCNQSQDASIALIFPSGKYFFNIPETFQRFSKRQGIRFSKNMKIFLTRIDCHSIGGLFGLLLTLCENQQTQDNVIYGSYPFYNLFKEMYKTMGLKMAYFSGYQWKDEKQKESKVIYGCDYKQLFNKYPNFKDNFEQIQNDLQQYLASQEKKQIHFYNPEKYLKNEIFEDENVQIEPIVLYNEENFKLYTQYICVIKSVRGSVQIEKIEELQVPKKQINTLLVNGQLTLDSGRIVHAEEIKAEDSIPQIILILDLPNKQIFQKLIKNSQLQKYFDKNQNNKLKLQLVINISSPILLEDLEYQNWIKQFDEEAIFIYVTDNKENDSGIEFPHFQLLQFMNQLFAEQYPCLKLDNQVMQFPNNLQINMQKLCSERFKIFQILVNDKWLYELKPDICNKILTVDSQKVNQIEKIGKKIQQIWKNEEVNKASQIKFKDFNPTLYFLGTGAQMPSKYRNVSCILLSMTQNENPLNMLLDCGEGTYYQMQTHFQSPALEKILIDLSIIFISHMHGDHHFGVFRIIDQREEILEKKQLKKTLFLIIPKKIFAWISFYKNFLSSWKNIEIILSSELMDKELQPYFTQYKEYFNNKFSIASSQPKIKVQKIKLSDNATTLTNFQTLLNQFHLKIETMPVLHCPQSFGILIQNSLANIKIAYSGDTMPSESMLLKCQNVDFLIHEATFTNDLQQKAAQFMHSTIQDAIEMGIKMNAKKVILTHFSQRYCNSGYPITKENQKNYEFAKQNVIFAFDHMRGELKDYDNFMHLVSKACFYLIDDDSE